MPLLKSYKLHQILQEMFYKKQITMNNSELIINLHFWAIQR